ncbi:hypothetical protein [Streptomyces rubrogriseus]|uniref:hypothetical protein n=1 Tax=Streptomyces rubrogriseus TaxID=194673 RepID=UPI00365FCCD0
MDTTKPIKAQPVVCPHCDVEVPQVEGPGRRKLYCTPDAGKQWRQRLRALGFPV